MTDTTPPTTRPTQPGAAPDLICGAAALIAAAAHVPVTGPHLDQAPYIGLAFIALEALLAILTPLLLTDGRDHYRITLASVCGSAILAYVLTRTVAFPLIADDVGNWFEPLGIVSVIAEAVVVMTALAGVAQRRQRT